MRRRDLLTVVLSALLGAGVVWILTRPAPPPAPQATRLGVSLPAEQRLDALALSPDGTRLVYSAEEGGRLQLYRRALDGFEIEPISGTEGAHNPFFSPDSQWVGFFADGRLRKIRADGTGAAENVCEAPIDSAGGAWSDDGMIVFAPLHGKGLVKVAATGGDPQPLTQPDLKAGEIAHGWPQVLPNGRGVLFTVSRPMRDSLIAVLQPDRSIRLLSLPVTGQVRYVSAGYLVYGLLGDLLAVPFDLDQLRARAGPFTVAKELRSSGGFDALERTWFSVSLAGPLVYVRGLVNDPSSLLVWVDRQGRAIPLSAAPGPYQSPRLSPDGKRLAVAIGSGFVTRDIWIHDIGRDTRARLSVEGGDNLSPVWTPDGRRLTFASNKSGSQNVYVVPLEAGAAPTLLLAGGAAHNPSSWSRDGRVLAGYDADPISGRDVWLLDSAGHVIPIVATGANERSPSLSPDGGWMAYVSDESGVDEVYVRPIEREAAPRRVSVGGGTEPVWSHDGREILYRQFERMMAVAVTVDPSLSLSSPQRLFERRYALDPGGNLPNYDVSPDGQRFVMLQSAERPAEIRAILNWLAQAPSAWRGK